MNQRPQDPYQDALAHMRRRDWHRALAVLGGPSSETQASHLILKAHCLHALGRRTEAVATATAARRLAPRDARMLDAAATVCSLAGDQAAALAAVEQAVALAPEEPAFRYNRATIRRFLGDLAGAEADYDAVIRRRPQDFEAYLNRSELRTQSPQHNHVAQLEGLLPQATADWRGAVQLRYAIAKELEDLEQYAPSFAHLQAGASLRRAQMTYDVTQDVATVDWIIESLPLGVLQGAAPPVPPQADSPIFIVGLPRTGSTLVERILSSHTEIAGAAELDCFARAVVATAATARGDAHLQRRELVQASASVDPAQLGQDYRVRAREILNVTGRFIDKMPLNFLYCGLIRRALPDAKIIHVTRHPMAACYAMYKTLFKDAYPFSYDFEDLARYYIAYRRLMQHWREGLQGSLFEIAYEDLIADQAGVTRRLLEHCGLAWQDACLEFHRNPSATTTASAAQVRRPLYATSVDRWRQLSVQLEPLRQRLADAGIST